MTCIVCGQSGSPFCPTHAAAPSGKRGGWLSAHRRNTQLAGGGSHQAPLSIDASNLVPKLWVGAKPPIDRTLPMFTMIVLAAAEVQPEQVPWTGRILRARLDDREPTQNEILTAVTAARQVAEEMRRGGRVLVTCYDGLNRSAWIASMAILMTRPKATPEAVITVVRRRRSEMALSNPHFEALLRKIWSSRSTERR